jgi:hypothetical protein
VKKEKRNLRGWEKRKRKIIFGDGSQRFDPNLLLSEANQKIVEGGISRISDACTMFLSMTLDRK